MALTNAKAGALYPNSSRALREALELGFDNAVVKDANGNIAELATANLWMVQDNVASTPALTGTFLAGVTRYRVACLLRENGIAVEETTLTESDLRNADEIFSTGNFAGGKDPRPLCGRFSFGAQECRSRHTPWNGR